MLLLFLLLHHVFAVAFKGLENVGVEQRGADVVQLDLDLIEIIMQAGFENFVDGAELQFGQEPAGEFFGVVGKTAFGHAGDLAEGVIQLLHAKADRAREIVIQQSKSATLRGFTSAP